MTPSPASSDASSWPLSSFAKVGAGKKKATGPHDQPPAEDTALGLVPGLAIGSSTSREPSWSTGLSHNRHRFEHKYIADAGSLKVGVVSGPEGQQPWHGPLNLLLRRLPGNIGGHHRPDLNRYQRVRTQIARPTGRCRQSEVLACRDQIVPISHVEHRDR